MFPAINGWTKEKMKARINEGMLDHKSKKPYRNGSSYFCAYRGADGNACAAGVFIPDGDYEEWMDDQDTKGGTGIDSILKTKPFLANSLPIELHGMKNLQECHDQTEDNSDPRSKLCLWIDLNVDDPS